MRQQPAHTVEGALVRRLTRVNLVAAVAFIIGGSLFALGAIFAQLGVVTLVTVKVTYLVGGFFFSLGGFSSILLAVNADPVRGGPNGADEMRWWGYQPHRRDWLSPGVVFFGGA